jgi:hypothetical protein
MISFSVEDFDEACLIRPQGYREHVLSYGKIEYGRVWLKPEDHTYLANYYRKEELTEPRFGDIITNFGKAVGRWVSAGFPVAPKKLIEERKQACESCPFWESQSRVGLGKCTHEECGCTKFKWWLLTEKCPDNRWPQIPVEETGEPSIIVQ